MNKQIRKLFAIILVMFMLLALAMTNTQFVKASSLVADGRNKRTILQHQKIDRGPIVVANSPIVSSQKMQDSEIFQRTYAQGSLYATATGFYSSANSYATGIEKAEEDSLSGESTAFFFQHLQGLFTGQHRKGGGVALTLNPKMQEAAAQILGDKRGSVVALDAKTGAVLAMYSSPSYDPNPLASLDPTESNDASNALNNDPRQPLKNRAIAGDRYAPGSTFKILSSIALIEKGIAEPNTRMDSPKTTQLPGTKTLLPNDKGMSCGNGTPTLAEAFARSCNTTFAIASQKLNNSDFQDLTSRFGFGKELSIPLKVSPSVFPKNTDPATLALSSIGQFDVQVTPLQMAMVAQAIANKGDLMKPYLVQNLLDSDLQVAKTTSPTSLGKPISPETAEKMTEMMRGVITQAYGTAHPLASANLDIAAKTGTAETGTQGYSNGWLVGFAPASNPKITFAVVIEGDAKTPEPYPAPMVKSFVEAGTK